MKRVILILACVGAVAWGGQAAIVNGVGLDVGKKLTIGPPIEFQNVIFCSCKARGTAEDGVMVSGYLVSNLPDHLYTVRMQVWLWDMYKGVTGPVTETIEIVVAAPEPKRRVRFVGFAMASPNVKAAHITYSLERLTALPAAKAAAAQVQ